MRNCVTYRNAPSAPVYFIDLDGMNGATCRQRKTTIVAYDEEDVVARDTFTVPVSRQPNQIDEVEQIQINPGIGYTFAKALKHILRHNPDVIMIGEIRDRETASIALESALTGHSTERISRLRPINSFKHAYNVVVLPEPVGPVTRSTPLLLGLLGQGKHATLTRTLVQQGGWRIGKHGLPNPFVNAQQFIGHDATMEAGVITFLASGGN